MNIKRALINYLVPMIFLTMAFFSCSSKKNWNHYINAESENHNQLEFLFDTLEKQSKPENRYTINLQICLILEKNEHVSERNTFLLEQVNQHPKDPFNNEYLDIVANYFIKNNSPKMAQIYYKRILRNHPQITSRGRPIEMLALKNLAKISSDPEKKCFYCNKLLTKYSKEISPAESYLMLAQNYEKLGEWDKSIQSWKKFKQSPYAGMQGEENLRKEAQKIINFYQYKDKDWTFNSLKVLARSIRRAISQKNDAAIRKNMSKINFFAVSWAQEKTAPNEKFLSSLGTFMRRKIQFNPKIEINSNDQEAYWETSHWSYRLRTWYLYFRRIDFPADPNIHGQWEWAGIYFGAKPFKSSD